MAQQDDFPLHIQWALGYAGNYLYEQKHTILRWAARDWSAMYWERLFRRLKPVQLGCALFSLRGTRPNPRGKNSGGKSIGTNCRSIAHTVPKSTSANGWIFSSATVKPHIFHGRIQGMIKKRHLLVNGNHEMPGHKIRTTAYRARTSRTFERRS